MNYISQYYYSLKQLSFSLENNFLELLIAVLYLVILGGIIFFIVKKSNKGRPLEYIDATGLYRIFISTPTWLSRTGYFSSELQIQGNKIKVWPGYFSKKRMYNLNEIENIDLDFFHNFVLFFRDGDEFKFKLDDRSSIKRVLDLFLSKKINFGEKLRKYHSELRDKIN